MGIKDKQRFKIVVAVVTGIKNSDFTSTIAQQRQKQKNSDFTFDKAILT